MPAYQSYPPSLWEGGTGGGTVPAPVLDSISPNTGVVGVPVLVTYTGSNFFPPGEEGESTCWADVALATTYISPTQLSATITAAFVGEENCQVRNSGVIVGSAYVSFTGTAAAVRQEPEPEGESTEPLYEAESP